MSMAPTRFLCVILFFETVKMLRFYTIKKKTQIF